MFAGEQFAAAAKAGGNLIGNQQNAFPIAHLTDAPQPFRMVKAHASRSLHHGFENNRGDFVAVGRQQPGERRNIPLVEFAAETADRGWREQVFRHVPLPQTVHRIVRIAHRHRAEGIAVITVSKGKKALTRLAPGMPVLQSHFHCHFHRYRTGIRQKHAFQGGRCHCDQLATQRYRGRVGDAAEHDVRHRVNLLFHRGVQSRVVVAVDRRPPG